ncbi:MAG: hypothetical protein LW875_05390 [Proteobacteria bacterium]|jgi:hypothetical protein|nr:hypothetical protein [Pseudomonadota bacterium]
MDEFHPAPTPLWRILAASPIFHILLVLIAVTASVLFIRQHHRAELKERAEFIQGGPILVERRSLDASLPAEAVNIETSSTSNSPPDLTTSNSTTPAASSTTSPETKLATSLEATKTANTDWHKKPKLRLSYFEMPRSLIEELAQEMQASGQYMRFDESQWGVVSDFKNKIQVTPGAIQLEHTEKIIELTGSENHWFSGQDSGLDFYLQATEEAGLIRAEIEIQRVFKEGESKTPLRKSFPISFEISAQQAFVISGLLPRNAVFEGPKPSVGYLKIFNSAQFLSRQTEFTLVLEFDTPSQR